MCGLCFTYFWKKFWFKFKYIYLVLVKMIAVAVLVLYKKKIITFFHHFLKTIASKLYLLKKINGDLVYTRKTKGRK